MMRVKKVVHHKKEPYDVYIGRGTKWGNPHVLTEDTPLERERVLTLYEKYILGKPELMADLPELDGKVLGCWCAPKLCHGDVLAALVAELE